MLLIFFSHFNTTLLHIGHCLLNNAALYSTLLNYMALTPFQMAHSDYLTVTMTS